MVQSRNPVLVYGYNRRKGAQLVVREAKEVRLRLFRHVNHSRFVLPSGGLRRFGLVETPDLGFYGFVIPVSGAQQAGGGKREVLSGSEQ